MATLLDNKIVLQVEELLCFQDCLHLRSNSLILWSACFCEYLKSSDDLQLAREGARKKELESHCNDILSDRENGQSETQ